MNFNVIRIAKTLPNKRTSLVRRNLKCSRTSAGLVEVRFPTQMCLIFVLPSGSEICARALVVFRRPTLNTIHCCSLLLMFLELWWCPIQRPSAYSTCAYATGTLQPAPTPPTFEDFDLVVTQFRGLPKSSTESKPRMDLNSQLISQMNPSLMSYPTTPIYPRRRVHMRSQTTPLRPRTISFLFKLHKL